MATVENESRNWDYIKAQLSTYRKPFITLFSYIQKLESDIIKELKINSDEVSIDFYLYNLKPIASQKLPNEVFRWFPEFDTNNFKNIELYLSDFLNNTDTICDYIDKDRKRNSINESRNILNSFRNKQNKEISDFDFVKIILNIYYLIFRMNVASSFNGDPLFIPGVLHHSIFLKELESSDRENKQKSLKFLLTLFNYIPKSNSNAALYKQTYNDFNDYYTKQRKRNNYQLQLNEMFVNDLPCINFGEKSYPQLTDKSKSYFDDRFAFFGVWINKLVASKIKNKRNEMFYYPIFDGFSEGEGILKGYLFLSSTRSNIKNCHLFLDRITNLQNHIVNLLYQGIYSSIVDGYTSFRDPFEYWKKNIFRLQNWKEISVVDSCPFSCKDLSCFHNNSIYLNIDEIIKRAPVKYSSELNFKYLLLSLPEKGNRIRGDIDDNYIKNRIKEVINLLDDILIRWEIFKQSTRAAITQVMSRNMSHNIGSHVLSRLVTDDPIIKLNPLDTIFNVCDVQGQYTPIGISSNEKTTNAKDISKFNSYLKSRMDFLADITTNVPTLLSTKYLFKDILAEFDRNSILLERISGIDDFNYTIISRNFTICQNKDFCKTLSKENRNGCIISESSNDVAIGVPNDVLGCHAFYVILENLIRNEAKHGNKDLTIYIDVYECEENNEYYEIIITGGQRKGSQKLLDEETTHKYEKYINLTNKNGQKEIRNIDKLRIDQNELINERLLKSDYTLRQGGWGLIEMTASAAYLRRIPVENIELDEYDIEISEISGKTDNKQLNIFKAVNKYDEYLSYKIYLIKPKEVLIYDPNNCITGIDENRKKELLNLGIEIINEITSNKVYEHNFLVLKNNINTEDFYTNNLGVFSKRYLQLDSFDELGAVLINPNSVKDTILEYLWFNYMNFNKSRCVYNFLEDLPFDENDWDKIKTDNSILRVCYDGHGQNFKEIEGAEFVEINSGLTKIFFPKKGDICLILEYCESIWNKIMILDERIQEYSEKGTYKPIDKPPIKIKDIYKKTNILVPNQENFNLNSSNYENIFCNIINYFQKNDYDFCVIHLGVIEKLIKAYNKNNGTLIYSDDKKGSIENTGQKGVINFIIDEMMGNNGQNKKFNLDKIIITSGRGKPHNLPAELRFLNYSIVSQYLIEIRYKYLFNKSIINSRKLLNN